MRQITIVSSRHHRYCDKEKKKNFISSRNQKKRAWRIVDTYLLTNNLTHGIDTDLYFITNYILPTTSRPQT